MLQIIFITALIVTTLLLALRKMGALDWYGARFGHIHWLPEAGCFLCLGFWMAGLFYFPLAAYSAITGAWLDAVYFTLVPFASTALSTYLTHEITRD